MTLVCYCCGEQYERGHFTCCAPPRDMRGAEWLELWCRKCGTREGQRKCPKHCACEKPELAEYKVTAGPSDWTPFSGIRIDLEKGWASK